MTSTLQLLPQLRKRIDDVLDGLIRSDRCALLDFPNYSNVGDSAIWLGEVEWLSSRRIEIVYACDIYAYAPELLRGKIGDAPILLSGGGNFGDLWYDHQRFREQVLTDFPGNQIIQLPQTINFLEDWSICEARRVVSAHPNFTLLVRDQRSFDFARHSLEAQAVLCPDMAFALHDIVAPAAPDVDILWLSRTDAESRGDVLPLITNIDIHQVDWIHEESTELAGLNKQLFDRFFQAEGDSVSIADQLIQTFDPLARQRLARGCSMLSRGRVVITDRLHGHILATLLGIPNVILDNSYGKLRGFYDAWTAASSLTSWANTPAEAVEVATQRLGHTA